MAQRVSVLGGGLWGAALAQHLAGARPRPQVVLWEFFEDAAQGLGRTRRHPHIPGFRLDPAVTVTSDLARAAEAPDYLVVVLPSQAVRGTARALRPLLPRGARPVIVNASKGVEPGSLMTMGDILARELPHSAVFTLSGPSFAREVARGVPTKIVLAGPRGHAPAAKRLFDAPPLSVSLSDDRRGVELGGSLKNVLAIGAGILDGLQAGANTKAALFVEGMHEMAGLIAASGGRRETMYGLSGLGDLILTGTGAESRNRAFGEKLGQGLSAARARREIPTVVEGAEAALSALALARRRRVKVPLIHAVHAVVHRGAPAAAVLKALGFRRI
jgi:glycerol-3-phosphate dehydrogenase (NAD(P)+)